ncbi:non-ribosomal peptide synthetase [Fusarium albosuccineum]|uniref:Non-ribosomal peptide synthetase n=1 Tax=Fusarium albosuccineum TaxID=1237068 RepID=A0A8H4LG57_9HYPO|nr:non-ribosomal peptide synthetase [Fusarium albosuccineum]
MDPPSCGCLEVADRSMQDLEPSIFPAFDVGEKNQSELLGFTSRLGCVAHGDLPQTCSVLCAAWGVLLGCFTGLENVCFGFDSEHSVTTSSGRVHGSMPTAQLNVPANQSVQSILTGSFSALLLLPQEKAKALFNTTLSIRSFAQEPSNDDDQNQTRRQESVSWCKIRMSVDPVTLDTVFSWDPAFMTREQASNVSNTYDKIVSEMINNPETLISDLNYFGEQNERQVLAWNNNPQNNVQKCIHQAIFEQGALRPDAEAVCAWDGSLSYSQLLSLSNRLAHRLQASGVGPEVLVPICFDKSKWTVVAMLAVLKAGGIFVPLDPTHPLPRLQALAHKMQAKTILCSPQHEGMLEGVAAELIPVGDQLFTKLAEDGDDVSCGSWSNGAYMIFTSGTTGEPKGALIQHGALLSSAIAHGPAMMMDSNTRSLQFAASTFDVSITEILTCMILGGCVCIPSEDARLNAIEEAITQLRANWALLTPTFVKFIDPANVPSLKILVTGGEALTQAVIDSWSHINLINCYGPAETSVVSHVHRGMTKGKNPLNIGHQVGIHCWVVDRYNHDRLMPVGAVGELLIEGHTLAREYYKEPEKTSEAFIVDPLWTLNQPRQNGHRRMYKTGDLVKYNHDGSFHISGRKGSQIKFHGQRIELGEIEHHLNVSTGIKHGMVVLAQEGFCKGRLLAIVQLSDALNQDLVPKGQPYKLLDGQHEDTARVKIAEAKQLLTERLPPYMIPSMWLAVEFIPRLQSGKLDRKQTAKWIDDMSEALYRQLNPVAAAGPSEELVFSSKTESELHKVWTHVLNLNVEQLGLRQSFLSVGGDSISAMQVMSECRKRGLGLTVSNIITCKSISALALQVKDIDRPSFHQEVVEQPFELSPIQKLYFARPNHAEGHYNQSFLLRTSHRIPESQMRRAIETIIWRHSMLRARFSQDAAGKWQQWVTNEVESSYRLRTLELASSDQVGRSLVDSQTCLGVTDGRPVFAADLIHVNGEEELLFVVAHHLVIDLVSWRIILQELEELLLQPELVHDTDRPLPFQIWCKMQLDHAESQTPEQALPVQGIPDGNAQYWGMGDTPNVYGQMAREGFEIGPEQTSLLLSKCHESLRTEIPDVLIAAMIFSFGQTFTDRPIPAVFAEGHGRESWDPSIDLSNVVGWFTTIYPVFAGSEVQSSLVDTAKLVKDGRRKVPDSGRPYFASRWLTKAGEDAFSRHWPLEITFNYLGQYQQLEREGALFTPVGDIAGEVKGASDGADVGPLTTCISLFEVSAVILRGSLRFSFVFNQNMNHQPEIRQWIASCQQSLGTLIESLSAKSPEPTLSDFPLLSLTYDRLRLLTEEKLPEAGVGSVDLVEDAYPCSPMQSGLLISTAKNNAFYAAYTLHVVKSRSGLPVDVTKLANAWKRMIEYHPMLRTIFVESVTQQDSLYDQVVLKEVDCPVIVSEKDTDEEALTALSAPPLHQKDNSRLLHHFEVCTSKSGKVFCRLDISHVIMDGTSLSILFRDLAMAYEGSRASAEGPLYRNYIKHLQDQAIQPGIDFWRSYLADVEPCHFPVLDDGNVVESKELRYLRVKFGELAELQSLCDDRGVTIVNAIYAAWALTLRLYTSSQEVCFGYLTSARDLQIEGIRDVVGPVINMVPCRVNFEASTTLGDMMSLVQRDYLDSLEYRHIPLAEVQHALHLSDAALFNTAVSYRKLLPAPQNPPDLIFEECRPTYDPDEYNVSVNIEAGEDDMAIDLMYWSDTLSDGQAANVASTFTKALGNVLHHCNKPVAQLEHLGSWHQQQLCQWNEQIPEAIESCLHDLFKQQAISRPDAPAIASWDMGFTYAELDDASTKLAHHISSLGVGPEDFVLVCFDKSSFAIVAMLAILKAGGACVPLDPAHPDAALQLRAEDTGASVVLVAPSMVSRLSTLAKTTVAVDAQLLQTISIAPDFSLPPVTPHNACFVIYTSGSTGRPKGVVLEHRGISTNAKYSGPKLGYEQNSRVLQFASYTFDNSLAEIFSTLTIGGCVCVPSDHERLNDLAGAINRYQVTLADLTPTVACFLQPTDVPTLKTLALGGEAVTTKCVDIWRDHVSLQCCYGPSECSVNSTYSGDIAQPGKATNIGRAIGSVAWVVDAADHNILVPIGCVGELLIDGPIVSRGYLNLPERMAQSFITPPTCLQGISQGGSLDRRLYKTGDLVCYNSDGTLTYHGRKDTQVKLNGQRIELGEIEHHVEKNLPEGWLSAVELVVTEGRKSLACFVCADADASLPDSSDECAILGLDDAFKTRATALEVLLSAAIPAYMVPTVWLPVSKMPLTPSGKLDRRSLRLLAQAVPTTLMNSYKLAVKYGRAPSTEMEKQLAGIWAQVLNIDAASIGVQDHFFRLGGDSIDAMKLVTLARQSDINLTVASIFQKASLLDMAHSALPMSKAAVTAVQPFSLLPEVSSIDLLKQEVAAFARINTEAIQDIYPCTATQEGLMALSIKEPGAYVAQLVYRLPDDIDTSRFKEACHLVVQAEPTLRTRIVHTDDAGFVQAVVAEDAPQWSTGASLSDVEQSRRQVPLHNGGRLTHYNLINNGSTGVLFVWTIHHALYDGWCLPLILDKIKRYYQESPNSAQLSGPSYRNFIRYLGEIDLDEADKFWTSELSNVSAQHFPRLPSPDYQASASSLMIHKAELSRQSGSDITMATRIRAAWTLTVSTYSAANDVVFLETVTGRDAPVAGIEEMIGATLATVPMRTTLEPSQTLAELLGNVQAQSAAMRTHQYAGIQYIKRINADAALACGAQNLMAINHGSRESTDDFWDEQTNEMAGTNFYSYPLMLSCHIGDGELETVVHFDQDIISASQMQRVMDQFALMLQTVSSSKLMDEKVGNLAMLTPNDTETLRDMSRVTTPLVDRLIHDVIQAQGIAQAQDKSAVCAWDQSLTYSELESQSTRLACVLVEAGVGVNSIVPFCIEKSSLVIVSILAILKSGAAFVPLDPAHPDARIKGILTDVEATVVLCSPQYGSRLENLGSKVIQVSQAFIHNILPGQQPAVSLPTVSPAYVIFTSGTTGKPKGTIIGHSAFCTGATAHGSAMGITESSRVLQFASHTFDASIMEMLTTLIHGGTVCVPNDEERINDITGAINRMQVNWALLTPSVAQLIQPSLVPGLKTLILGGEAMSSAHISSWASSVQLMNAYGPSETAVVATVNPAVTLASGPSNIGHAVGGLCWVVDAANHDRLVPIGAVGELVVEGPILAQGYLKNPQKTAESFITNPRWCNEFPSAAAGTERRFYKTGDLVKVTEDSTILFQGRKDNQVKINGQRLELSEVEHHLSADPVIQYGLATVPSSGPFKGRLAAVLSLQSLAVMQRKMAEDEGMQIAGEYASSQLTGIRERLATHLTSYMIPSTWIVVDRISLLLSGKLDRRRVVDWVENMTAEQHQLVLDAQEKASGLDREPSEVELKLRAAWAKVLNLKLDKVPFKQSFLHLGGDSISAMQLMAVCRSSDMAVSVSQIMQSKSIIELASCVTAAEDVKVYFECIATDSTHFNQSMLLGTTRTIISQELSSALETIIKTHSMLRARFSYDNGKWSQRITNNVAGSYTLRSHADVEQSRLSALIEESQTCLNIIEGPLLTADIFQMESTGNQVVAFVAHHLVVDVVSWNIILQDLEGLLSSTTYTPAKALSFQTWSSLQHEQVHETALEHVFHGVPLPLQDLSYWGMQGVPNLHGDSVTETMEITTDDSLLLLGSCHDALHTDIVDVLLASLLASFRQIFSDRPIAPSIFNEGHGREPWDDKLDLSRTVGWFTTLCPVYLPESLSPELDILDIVRWVRDFRRKLPGKGRPYFAHSMLSPESQAHTREWPVEIAFNFLGQTQRVESEESVFRSLGGGMLDSVSSETDIGADVPRLALVEISASFSGDKLSFEFSFNRHMHRQSSIEKWIGACKGSIHETVQNLSRARPEPTADLSLLPLAIGGASQIEPRLTEVGIGDLNDVEAAYPCSPTQQGILFAQIRDPGYYSYSITFSVNCAQPSGALDVQRLEDAWRHVVQRHSTLRTVFVDNLIQEGAMDQVVLRKHQPSIAFLECSDDELAQRLGERSRLGLPVNQPPHRLNIFKTPEGTVRCFLEMGHAIADGTSMPILFRDLALAYEGALAATSLTVYSDYVAYLQRSRSSRNVNYWKDYLTGAEPCCLPSLVDGAAEPKVLRALDWRISRATELQAFCTERGVTLSNVLQLAWALVLQAYTGFDDVCFGYLVAGRDIPVRDINEAVGVFINMLVCRVRLNPSTSLGDVVQTVQEDLATAMNHKLVSLADLQHVMGMSNEPLFNTAYSFQRRSVSKSMATGPVSFDVSDAQDPSEYDMTVNVEVWDSNVELQLCYWTDKILDSQARNIASTFDQILTSIVTCQSTVPIGELNLLSEHCSQQLVSWNNAEPEFLDKCVHHVFEHNAQQQPDEKPAVQAWDASFTYLELDAVASQLAQHLVSLGVRPEMYVPLCFEKSAWTVVAMIAVLKAGGAFVPLDPAHPPERINFLVHNVDAKLILCSSSLAHKFGSLGIPTFAVGQETVSLLPTVPTGLLRVQVKPSNPAYVIFTSGTTGLPKGTIIEHGAFTTGGTAHAKAIKMTSTSRVLQFASHTFDASVMEILSTLLVGGCVCIPSDQERMNDLAAVITKLNVNWTLLTPSVASVLKPESVPTLSVLVTGGESMPAGHITKWANHAALVNAYGPSETSVIAATSTKVDHDGNVLNSEPATIGHAVGSRCWIVDPRNHNRLMPIGSIGELLVEGPIVARGYLSNETKTRDAFIERPSWRTDMKLVGDRIDRMYKTGDLVAYNSDGSFNYISRKDTQIKLNGQRIELGEIEHHVKANLPADVQSAVDLVVPQSKTSTKALAVFFTSDDKALGLGSPNKAEDTTFGEPDAILLPMSSASTKLGQSLKAALGAALPSHMVPTVYIPIIKMPWTSAGKLDRRSLKAIVQSIPPQQMAPYKLAGASQNRAPTTLMQRKLQKVWGKVLNLGSDGISRDDSFFRLGGDSVGAMKLVAAARMEDVVLTVMNVFKNPVLSDMATSCKRSNDGAITVVKRLSLLRDVASPSLLLDELAERCSVQRSQIQDVYPCSSLQEGLVASSMQQPGAYVARNVFELPLSIDIDRLKLAWQRTVDQVDILRSRIVNTQSLKSYQVVLEPHAIEWDNHSSLDSATDKTQSVPEQNGGALARYAMVNSADSGSRYFVWTVHHALYDAWSMPALLKLVSQFYYGDGVERLQPAIPFANFVKYLADIDAQASDEFWKARFQGASSTSHFPTMSSSIGAETSSASRKHTIQYKREGLGIDVTIPTVVRAAWALVLGSQAGSDDVVFGETLSGRDIALDHVEDILGPTLTTVPSRVQIDRDATVGQFLTTLHKQAAEVIPHQHAGLQNVKRLGGAMAVACDFRNLLVIQSTDEATGQQDFLQPLEGVLEQSNFFTYPLVVECFIEAHNLVLVIHHDQAVVTSWQVERIARQFGALVEQLLCLSQDPTRKVSELRLYSQDDVEMIKEWNHQTVEPVEESIPSLFWQSATMQPDATIIRAWDGHLSYDAVAQHAVRLAKLLIQKGVHAETLVPCCMDKSLWTSVSMLAVILAGGVIVPLDPAHPPARHAEITRECVAHVALCSPQYQDRFNGLVESVVLVNEDLFTTHLSHQDATRQDLPTVTSQDAAIVIYTSGSTGKPKGIVIEHGSFCASTKAYMKRMNLTPTSSVFHFTSYAFDIAMGETFGALTSGACLCVPSEEMRTADLPGAMNSLGATWAFLTPSVANIQDPTKFKTLRTLVCGGEALTAETISTWADKVELMNGYGPAECTIFAVTNTDVSIAKDHTNIGRATDGGHTWVVDPRDHNYLVPVGCVGELLISGPIVSRGYLNDSAKTSQSFIENPAWMNRFFNEEHQQWPLRLYKTGDLVKYCPDGSLTYCGRKDHQVKLNGQRMELGEIEVRLESDPRIRHALVALPKSGVAKGRLVAIVSLEHLVSGKSCLESSEFVPVSASSMEPAQAQISAIQNQLSENLPPYMVPSAWFVVKAIPLLLSGKLDRASAQAWLANMDAGMYNTAAGSECSDGVAESDTTPVGRQLRRIWASVLNMADETTPMNRSLISLGGDSIMAIQIMTRCRDQSFRLSMQEIMKAKSITELATLIETEDRQIQNVAPQQEEQPNQPFELSPIQQFFFNNSSNKDHGDLFNQSQLLSINSPVDVSKFEQAVRALVHRHPMLRARFQKSPDGRWTQHIASDVETTYSFRFHESVTRSDMISFIAASQKSIHISGPVFIVDLFAQPDGSQVASLIAHHLVVDIVSWINIVQDLETSLSAASPVSSRPLSFREWHAAQIEHAKSPERQGGDLLPFPVQPANLDFWGMSSTANAYGDVKQKSFVVSDADIISLVLGDSHTALKTEPIDLFISALLKSFGDSFEERELPTLFNEGHGREPWDDTIDLSQTVGWFTSLCPVHVSRHDLDPVDIIDCVRRVKDVRRSVPSNGRPYFARRYLTESGRRHLNSHEPMEVVLNFLGRTQQTSQGNSLFASVDLSMTKEELAAISDVAPETHRTALFEVSISILDEGIKFTFMYNQHMLHQDRIEKWVSNCEEVLINTAKGLSETPSTPTLSDFPLMPVGYTELQKLVNKSLPAAHVRFDEVMDIYPCSPMQTGILLSQLLNPSQYLFHTVLEVASPNGSTIDTAKLSQACREVIDRHPALRTVFVDSVYRGGSFDQVVLKSPESRITIIKCREIEVMAKLNTRSLEKTNKRHDGPILPYQITICQTPQGKAFIKIEMNHAITDGASTSVILRDISNAYTNSLSSTKAPSYKKYIEYIFNQSTDSSLQFWTGYLSGAQFTGFPTVNPDTTTVRSLGSVAVEFDRFSQLHALGRESGVTLSNIITVAWALVLRSYTKSEDVTFGYLASGRDAPIDGIDDIVGPLINMLVFRFQFAPGMLLERLFLDAQEDYIASLPHQHFSLARLSHVLGQAKRGFFNTAISIQNAGSSSGSDLNALTYESVEAFDPSEYAVTLNANTTRGDEGIVFRYWTDVLSDSQAEDLALTMSELLSDFVDRSEKALSHLRLFQGVQLPTNGYTHAHEVDRWGFQHGDPKCEAIIHSSTSSEPSTDLSATLFSPPNASAPFARDRDHLHRKLLELWRDTLDLGNAAVSYDDSFFELGGDSIIAMSMVGNARELEITLTVADIFKNPNFGSMLDCLLGRSCKDYDTASSQDFSDSKNEVATIDEQVYKPFSMLGQGNAEQFVRDHVCTIAGVSRASIIDVLPTSDFQAQAIAGSLLDSRWMLNYFHLDSSGPLDIGLLQESITNIVACYDVLRTVFVSHQKGYLQVILRHVQPQLTVHDVDDIEQFTSELRSSHQQEAPRPEQSALRISHAQYDGVCFPAILEALKACYEGEPIFPTPPYATYIRGALGKINSGHYAYWRSLLKNSTPTHVIQRQRTSLHTTPTQVLKRVVSTPSLASFNITTATVVKAAWSTILAKATGKTDVVFGHLISGRNVASVPGIESIVGPCLNVVPVRVRHQPSWTVLHLLQHIQNQQVDNMPYESLGSKEIIDKCTDWDDDGANGFSTIVQHQSMPQTGALAIGGNTYQVGAMASQEDPADFSVVTTPQDANNTEVCLLYARDGAVDAAVAEQMFDSLCCSITEFSKNLDTFVTVS